MKEELGDGRLTRGSDYADRLSRLQAKQWKERLRAVDPFEWHIKRVCQGQVLEIGCGIGRNLHAISDRSVGVDHNKKAIQICRDRNLVAYEPGEFAASDFARQSFDTILLAHVLEHIDEPIETEIFDTYLPYLKKGGKVVLICPQEKGYDSDSTHIRWMDEQLLIESLTRLGCTEITSSSYPFPRSFGSRFIYNQFVVTGILPH